MKKLASKDVVVGTLAYGWAVIEGNDVHLQRALVPVIVTGLDGVTACATVVGDCRSMVDVNISGEFCCLFRPEKDDLP